MVSIIESSMLSALAGAESFMNNGKVHVLSFLCKEIGSQSPALSKYLFG